LTPKGGFVLRKEKGAGERVGEEREDDAEGAEKRDAHKVGLI